MASAPAAADLAHAESGSDFRTLKKKINTLTRKVKLRDERLGKKDDKIHNLTEKSRRNDEEIGSFKRKIEEFRRELSAKDQEIDAIKKDIIRSKYYEGVDADRDAAGDITINGVAVRFLGPGVSVKELRHISISGSTSISRTSLVFHP